MRRSLLILLLLCPLLGPPAAADTYDTHSLVRLAGLDKAQKGLLVGLRVHVLEAGEDWARALLTPEELASLGTLGFEIEVLHDEMARDRQLWQRALAVKGPSAYYTASAFDTVSPPAGSLMEHLLELHDAHPDITRLHDIGDCVSGRYDILAIQVTDNPDVEEVEPEIRLYGNIHGNEKSGLMVTCDALDWILDNYPADPDARKLVDEAELWFIPMGNPDGNADSTRFNRNGVDLNRNFWGPEGHWSGPVPFSEPETQAIRDLTEVMGKRFVTSLSFHSGAICFNSLYNYAAMSTSEEPLLFTTRTGGPEDEADPSPHGLAEAYWQGCTTPGFWYTNGADWYDVRGDTNDWSYGQWSALDTTLEVTEAGTPPPEQIEDYTAEHRRAVINYMLKTFQGVAGVMTAAASGAPLDGRVVATAVQSPFSQVPHVYQAVMTDPDVGDFHRVLPPGSYSIECLADGHEPLVIPDVVVLADQTTRVDCSPRGTWLAYQTSLARDSCSVPGSVPDGILDAGEQIELELTIRNEGIEPGTNVTASLSSTTPGVTVLNMTTSFADMSPAASETSVSPHLSFHIDRLIACGTPVDLVLQIRSDQGVYADVFQLVVGDSIASGGTLLAEDFDGVAAPALPSGWAVEDEEGDEGRWATSADTVHPPDRGPDSGANLVYFNSWAADEGQSNRLYRTTGLTLESATGASLGFSMYHESGSSRRDDRVQVQASSDAGASWQDVGAPVSRYAEDEGWQRHGVDLSVHLGEPDLRIALLGQSEYGNDCHVDDIELTYSAPGSCNMTVCDAAGPPGEVSALGAAVRLKLAKDPVTCPAGSCIYFESLSAADGYHVYAGELGVWYSHGGAAATVCDAVTTDPGDGSLRVALNVGDGNHYLLVTAFNVRGEGTAGNAGRDTQRSCPP